MKKLIILIIIISFFLSCDYFSLMSYKEWLAKNNGKDTIVYVAGFYDFGGAVEQGCYWKIKDNDIDLVYLPGTLNSRAYSIFVYASNIYTCGYYVNQACYWINDKLYELEGSENIPSRALSIKVINTDVYVAGYYTSGGSKACYWKNGNYTILNKKEHPPKLNLYLL